GYGGFWQGGAGGTYHLAHRIAYSLLVRPLAQHEHLDHLCRNRACVNPAHLEPVSLKENVLRGIGITAINAKKTHCFAGHEFTSENTRVWRGKRHCRKCAAARARATYYAKKEVA